MISYVYVNVLASQILELQAWLDANMDSWYHHLHRSHFPNYSPEREMEYREHTRALYSNMAKADPDPDLTQTLFLAFDQLSDAQMVMLKLNWNAVQFDINAI
jgi:hypothetical protein